MAWRLSNNLAAIRQSIWDHFGEHVTVGTIGDSAHQNSTSDHNPDARGIVCAIDVMYPVGSKASAVVRASIGRPDLQYIIHNHTIWSASVGWGARQYTGSNPHTDHVHLSSKHTSAADNYVTGLSFSSVPTPAPTPVPTFAVPVYSGELRRGSQSAAVRVLQQRLNQRGYQHLNTDGQYGPATEANVRRFQRFAHLSIDGRVGPKTWSALWTLRIT